jgi:hypothetical protein
MNTGPNPRINRVPERTGWSTPGRFSPGGDRVALLASDRSGAYRLYLFSGERHEPVIAELPGGPTYGPIWVKETELVFASSAPGLPLATWIARLR